MSLGGEPTDRLKTLTQDWCWNEANHEFACQAGSFLLQSVTQPSTSLVAHGVSFQANKSKIPAQDMGDIPRDLKPAPICGIGAYI
jgi:hypothetical protein